MFLYAEVLHAPLDGLTAPIRARDRSRLPVVLTRDDIGGVFGQMTGPTRLMAQLMYGSGLRLLECCELRVKDVDFARHEVFVRDGKGRHDRVTMLARALELPLRRHLEGVKRQHAAISRSGSAQWR